MIEHLVRAITRRVREVLVELGLVEPQCPYDADGTTRCYDCPYFLDCPKRKRRE